VRKSPSERKCPLSLPHAEGERLSLLEVGGKASADGFPPKRKGYFTGRLVLVFTLGEGDSQKMPQTNGCTG